MLTKLGEFPGTREPKRHYLILTGGTGKFEGIRADLVITQVPPLKGNYEGIFQAIGRKAGSYKIVKTN